MVIEGDGAALEDGRPGRSPGSCIANGVRQEQGRLAPTARTPRRSSLTVGERPEPGRSREALDGPDRRLPRRGRRAARGRLRRDRQHPARASATRTRSSSWSTSSTCSPTSPAGTDRGAGRAGLPSSSRRTAIPPASTSPARRQPTDKLQVITLIEGDGPAIEKGQTVVRRTTSARSTAARSLRRVATSAEPVAVHRRRGQRHQGLGQGPGRASRSAAGSC